MEFENWNLKHNEIITEISFHFYQMEWKTGSQTGRTYFLGEAAMKLPKVQSGEVVDDVMHDDTMKGEHLIEATSV